MIAMKRYATILSGALAACASTAVFRGDFSLQRAASTAAEIGAVAERVALTRASATPPLAVLVDADPSTGFAIHALPSGQRLARVDARLQSRPWIAGDLVLARVGSEVVAWGTDGQRRWAVPDGGTDLVGAARDGDLVALTLGGAGVSRRNGTLLVVDASRGAVRMRRADGHAFGVPAIAGDDVALPWDGQNVSILSVREDREVARVRSRDDVIGWARREGPSLWFGARSLYRLDRAASAGTREAATRFAFTRDDLPGAAPFAPDGYTSLRAGVDARERVRLLWRPDPSGAGARVAGATVYALFHQVVFGMDPQDGAVRWAYLHRGDLVGAEATAQGAVLADADGDVMLLDARDGRVAWRVAAGARSSQAVLQVPVDAVFSGGGEAAARPRVDALLAVARSTETRLLPARTFAVRALAAIDEPAASAALVQVLVDAAAPPELRSLAGDALARRTNTTEALRAALETHYDFVRGTAAPPSGQLARGVATAADRRATPLIAAHLLDPATPTAELPALAAALRELGDPSAVPMLDEFVRRYHADIGRVVPPGGTDAIEERDLGEQQHIDAALEQAVEALARLAGPRAERLLARVEAHPTTPEPVRAAAARALAVVRAAAQQASRAPEPPSPAPQPARSAAEPALATSPAPSTASASATLGSRVDLTLAEPVTRLSQSAIDEAFTALRPRLLECLRGAPSRPLQVRIQFRYEGDGSISQPVVLPTAFGACMGPIVQSLRLPGSAASRELGTYFLQTM